jgi:hypothetical protein
MIEKLKPYTIYTERVFDLMQSLDQIVWVWPNLWPVKDNISPDKPSLKFVQGIVTEANYGDETRFNSYTIDPRVTWNDDFQDYLFEQKKQRESESFHSWEEYT